MSEPDTTLDVSGGILVGHDGSAPSAQAVTWAAGWARRAGCTLHVVRTWVISSAPRPATWSPGYVPPMADFEEAVRERLRADVAGLGLEADGLTVDCHVLHGSAGKRLVEASGQVELVVVAARGVGALRDRLLGSTADHVVHHARCPVVILPSHALHPTNPVDPDSRPAGE